MRCHLPRTYSVLMTRLLLNAHYFLALPSVEQRYGRFFPQMTEERSGNMRLMWCLDRKWPCYQSPKPAAFISLYFKRNQYREIGREKWIYLYFCQTGHRKKKFWFPFQHACGNLITHREAKARRSEYLIVSGLNQPCPWRKATGLWVVSIDSILSLEGLNLIPLNCLFCCCPQDC